MAETEPPGPSSQNVVAVQETLIGDGVNLAGLHVEEKYDVIARVIGSTLTVARGQLQGQVTHASPMCRLSDGVWGPH